MAVIVLSRQKLVDTIKDIQVWCIAALSAIPALAYNIYGLFITGELESQLKGRFFPQMWEDLDFYIQWKNAISSVSGHYLILLIGLLGLVFIKNNRHRLYLLGIWFGYVLYGFTLSYHISTHYYYTLPVIPLLSITLGAVAERVFDWIRGTRLTWIIRAGTVIVVILGISGGYYILSKNDFRNDPPYYQKVASFVDPEDKIVALSQDYGYRLSYYGWRYAIPWKGTEDLRFIELRDSEVDPFSKRFAEFATGYDFFIITRLKDFRRQTNLFEELNNHYPIIKEGGGYVIFNLRERQE
jgi:hypothetical protein